MGRTLFITPALTLLIVGCGGDEMANVRGRATFNGQPIERGYITFIPQDGAGATSGGAIAHGRFDAFDMRPGQKVVQIMAVRDVAFPRTTDDVSRTVPKGTIRTNTGLVEPTDEIPPNAEGNNRVVDVVVGAQEIDFDITIPPAKTP